jgi:hypothetical protein
MAAAVLAASDDCCWRNGVVEATTQLSGARKQMGRTGDAFALAQHAIDLSEDLGQPDMQAASNAILGSSHWWFGDLTLALRHQERAYALYRRTGSVFSQPSA